MKKKLNNEKKLEKQNIELYYDTEYNTIKSNFSSTAAGTIFTSAEAATENLISTSDMIINIDSDTNTFFDSEYIEKTNSETIDFYKSLIKDLLLLFENLETSIEFPKEEKLLFKKVFKTYLKKSTDMQEIEVERLLEKVI